MTMLVIMFYLFTIGVDIVDQHSIFSVNIIPEETNFSHFTFLVDRWQVGAWLCHNGVILYWAYQ